MTNAPYMLNVDCDMFANSPQVVRQAMCQLLDSKSEREIGFVQFPQCFYDGPKDDPYGNQLVVLYEYMGRGIAGLEGISYSGTGCFHRRKVIYGQWPEDVENQARNHTSINGKLVDNEVLIKEFGKCKRFSESAAYALKGKKSTFSNNLSDCLEEAFHVASCDYEFGTSWGNKIGWIYGSMTEDVMTGLMIHKKGWKSALPMPKPQGFLGCAPSGGPAAMTQQKRWATGLLEILVSKNSPIFAFLTGKLPFRMLLFYIWLLCWGLFSIPELCYAALPAYCIIANSQFLPKVQEPAMLIPVAIFVIFNLLTIREYLKAGMSIRGWWNFMKMGRITRTSAYLLAALTMVLKLLRLSETVFEVTQKDQSNSDGDNETNKGAIKFTFDESPLFVPGTTLLLVQLTALLSFSLGLRPLAHDVGHGLGLGEVLCSLWANITEAKNILELLRQYEAASGQFVNIDKSANYFINDTYMASREDIKQHLGLRKVGGQLVLEGGNRWRIGDGLLVRIMDDNWVPTLPQGKPSSIHSREGQFPCIFVADLINHEERSWKEDLLYELFKQHDPTTIMDIRLSMERVVDKLICVESKLDVFTAEVTTVLFGLEFAWEHGISNIVVESDSSGIVDEIRKGRESLWQEASLVHDITAMLPYFEFISFHFVKREANGLAHNIAKSECELGAHRGKTLQTMVFSNVEKTGSESEPDSLSVLPV
ncbi:Cellulose synthase [Corchorus capsularis]|uniref:Cellulose synthase n=1 Tax=Corchorus capsularis TaxID=210143 RepID=A0A1R3KFY7_COCAP|nr:Cellulose synthase [Corchorus capsularis]